MAPLEGGVLPAVVHDAAVAQVLSAVVTPLAVKVSSAPTQLDSDVLSVQASGLRTLLPPNE